MNISFVYNFRSLSNKFPTIFLKFNFLYFTVEKGNLNFSVSKKGGERNNKNSHFCNTKKINCTLKFLGKIIQEPL